MSWLLERSPTTVPPWAQWVDRENAEAWLAELRRLVALPSPGEAATTDAMLVEGRSQTVALWTAVGAVARACDLPAKALWCYAQERLKLDNGFVDSESSGRPLPLPPGEFLAEVYRQLQAKDSTVWREIRDDGGILQLKVIWRVELDDAGIVDTRNLLLIDPPDLEDGDTLHNGCVGAGAGGGHSSWDCWTWWETEKTFGAADDRVYVVALPPLEVFWSMGRRMADALLAETVNTIVTRSRYYVLMKNLLTARAIGAELPEDIVTYVAQAERERQRSPWSLDILGSAGAGLAPLIGLLLGSGVGGALVGAFVGLPALLLTIVGQAQGRALDGWGRREPVIERSYLSGGLDPPTEPVQVLAWPGGGASAPRRPRSPGGRQAYNEGRAPTAPALTGPRNQTNQPPPPAKGLPPVAKAGLLALLTYLVTRR